MVLQIFVVVFLFTQFLLAPAFKLEDILTDPKELPPEFRDFLSNLTEADETLLEDFANAGLSNSDEDVVNAIAALKKKSPELGAKVEKLRSISKGKIAALGPEARGFAEKAEEIGREFMARFFTDNKPTLNDLIAKAGEILKLYKALSDDAKAEYGKQFPLLSEVWSSEETAKLISGRN
ncbi:hypothetical protein RB195_011859 [Necator americanus]